MGFVIYPDGYESGNACVKCWGVGKKFGDVDTPKFIYAYFYGIEKSLNWLPWMGQPGNGWYKMEQQVNPCIWQSPDVLPRASLSFTLNTTSIQLQPVILARSFLANPAPACLTFVDNELVNPLDWIFINGSCMIWPGIVGQELLFTMGMCTLDNTRMTLRGNANGDYVLRFTNPDGHTNFKVRIDPAFF